MTGLVIDARRKIESASTGWPVLGFRLASPARENLFAVPRYRQRSRADLARFDSSSQQAEGPFELCGRHADSRRIARLQNRSVRCHRVSFF